MAQFLAAVFSFLVVGSIFLLLPGQDALAIAFVAPAAAALAAAIVAGGRPAATALGSSLGGLIPYSVWLAAAFADTDGGFYPAVVLAWILGFFAVAGLGSWMAASLAGAIPSRLR